jgi:hypothetical protein
MFSQKDGDLLYAQRQTLNAESSKGEGFILTLPYDFVVNKICCSTSKEKIKKD